MLGVVRQIALILDTAAYVPVVLLASLLDPQAKIAYGICRSWAWLNAKVAGARIHVEGLEHLDPRQSYVFVSNHRSNLDVLALMVGLADFQLRWVAKEELTRIPGFGWALKATKQIIVDRRDHAQAVASLQAAKEQIANGISVVFFPEGHRSEGPMLPFKKGGFVFAIETGTPLVPIGILGTGEILPATSWVVERGGDVRVVIDRPITTTHLTLADRDQLRDRARQAITALVRRSAPAQAMHGAAARAGANGIARPRTEVLQ